MRHAARASTRTPRPPARGALSPAPRRARSEKPASVTEIKEALEGGNPVAKAQAMKGVISQLLNGETLPGIFITIVRYVLPSEDHSVQARRAREGGGGAPVTDRPRGRSDRPARALSTSRVAPPVSPTRRAEAAAAVPGAC